MPNNDKVVWSEGTFMQPQHLQQHTRYVEGLVNASADSANPFGWGFSDLHLDVSLLSSGILGINSARGTFRDATPFDFHGESIPAQINLAKTNPGALVYLCAKLPGGGSRGQEFTAQSDERTSTRYLAHLLEVVDNAAALALTEEDATPRRPGSTSIVVGQLHTELLTDVKEINECLHLPVARVSDVLGNGGVKLDEAFIAPTTKLSASLVLSHYVRELGSVVASRADQLARKIGDIGSGAEFSLNLLWLMHANRYDPVFQTLASTEIHPAALYRLLLGMAGELSTLNSADRRPAKCEPYDHMNPAECFTPLMNELRSIWSSQPEEMVIELPMNPVKSRQTWLSQISNHNLLRNADFVVAAKSELSEDELAVSLPEQMIIAPTEQIDQKISVLRLVLAKNKPSNVPRLNRWAYFHLEAESSAWDALSRSAAFAFFVDRLEQDFPKLQLKFWALPRQ